MSFLWVVVFLCLFSSLVIINFALFSRKELLKIFTHKFGLMIAVALAVALGLTGVFVTLSLLKK